MGKHQLVPKVLSIYSDMLRRKVSPDPTFYSTVIQILARRALYVAQAKKDFEQQRSRYGSLGASGKFLLASHTTEYALLVEDDALKNAVGLFNSAVPKFRDAVFSAETYQILIHACAEQANMHDMVRVYQHMESRKAKPNASIFPEMINAFAKSKDLESATECYNEYRLQTMQVASPFSVVTTQVSMPL